MASQKANIQVTPGAGTSLPVENEADGSKSPIHYVFSGRYIPVKPAVYTAVAPSTPGCHIQVTTAATVDLMGLVPAGATRLLLHNATFSSSFWDNGFDPRTDGQGGVIDADTWMEFANLPELTNLKFAGLAGTADLYMYWYKTK